jgi:hypothetical protein
MAGKKQATVVGMFYKSDDPYIQQYSLDVDNKPYEHALLPFNEKRVKVTLSNMKNRVTFTADFEKSIDPYYGQYGININNAVVERKLKSLEGKRVRVTLEV